MLTEKTVAELKAFCDDFEIEYSKTAKKQEIIKAIETSGFTFSDYESSSLGFKEYVEEIKEEAIEKVVKEVEIEVSNETMLLTTIAGIGAYVRGIKFEYDDPYAFVEKNLAQLILSEEANGMREASLEEYNSFRDNR